MIISYSSLNSLDACHKWWICRMLELPKEDFQYFEEGRAGHKKIQEHVSKKNINIDLMSKGISFPEYHFPLVEEKELDEKMKFEIPIGDKYLLIGYVDGLDIPDRMLEIKLSSSLWGMTKFINDPQRKIYYLAHPKVKRQYLITGKKDLTEISSFYIEPKPSDKSDALKWIVERINIINKGDFDGGKCINCYRCVYRRSCKWSKWSD